MSGESALEIPPDTASGEQPCRAALGAWVKRRTTFQKWIILIAMLALLAWLEFGDLWRIVFAGAI